MNQLAEHEPISLRRMLRESILFGFVSVFDKAIGFVLMLVITHLLWEADYGLLTVFGTTQTLLTLGFAMGLQTTFFRYYAEAHEPDRKGLIFDTAIWVGLATSSVGLGIVGIGYRWLDGMIFGASAGQWLMLMAAAGAILDFVVETSVCRLQADARTSGFLAVELTNILAIRGLAFGLILCGWRAIGWIYGQLLGQLLAATLALWLVLREFRGRFEIRLAWTLWLHGASLVPVALSHWFMRGCDKYMIDALVVNGRAQLGLYGVGERISSIMDLVLLGLLLGWRRFAFRNMHIADGPRLLARGTTLCILVTGYAAVSLVLLGDDLFYWCVNHNYLAGTVVIAPLTFGSLLWGLGEIVSFGLYRTMRLPWLVAINVVAALFNVGLNWWLIPPYGILGAAGATCCCQALKFAATYLASQTQYPIRYEMGRLGVALGLFIGAMLIGTWCDPERLGWPAATLIQLMIVVLIPGVFFVVGFFRPEELAWMRDWLHKLRRLIFDRRP